MRQYGMCTSIHVYIIFETMHYHNGDIQKLKVFQHLKYFQKRTIKAVHFARYAYCMYLLTLIFFYDTIHKFILLQN